MIRRIIAGGALAAALVLAPTAANAYTPEGPGVQTTVTVTQPGVPFPVTCSYDGVVCQLEIFTPGDYFASVAGTVTSAEKTLVDGVATFEVTAPEGFTGTMGVTAIVDGVAAGTTSVEVVAAEAATDDLASTGFENAGLAAGAGALLVAGAGAVFVAARRRQAQNA